MCRSLWSKLNIGLWNPIGQFDMLCRNVGRGVEGKGIEGKGIEGRRN